MKLLSSTPGSGLSTFTLLALVWSCSAFAPSGRSTAVLRPRALWGARPLTPSPPPSSLALSYSPPASPSALGAVAGGSPDGALLAECLDELSQHAGKTVVVKYGGHAMSDENAAALFARDIVLLQRVGVRVVIVHGGGPQIKSMLTRLGINSTFVDGLRVTDAATVEVAEMVLCGSINKAITSAINGAGGRAIGLSGKDDDLVVARKLYRSGSDGLGGDRAADLGFVGTPQRINTDALDTLLDAGLVPVIAPIGVGASDRQTYNINADTVAGAVASAVGASRLLLLTDVKGVLDGAGELLTQLSPERVTALMDDGTISGGMIPKLETATDAVKAGVTSAVIVDGRVPHAVLLELFSAGGAGTMITQGDAAPADAATAPGGAVA